MSLKIGTNIEYNGRKFLDSRQGKANTIEDLKTWSTPVPEGFEISLGGTWYIYSSSLPVSQETGHFHLRPDYDIPGSEYGTRIDREIGKIEEEISKITTLEVTSKSGGGVFEAGRLINPAMTWTIAVSGIEVTPENVIVNGVELGPRSYYTESNLGESKTYTVVIQYQGMETTIVFQYNFVDLSFWGVSSVAGLEIPPEGFSSDLLIDFPKEPIVFDCSSGAYPYYIYPGYLGSIEKFVVGGIPTTDLVISTVTLVNSYGKETEYTVSRLGNRYNGNLKIKFENE